jgi:hypothetical protein
MGGLFDPPKAPRVASPPTVPAARPNLMKLESQQRLDALQRQQRGIAGTIVTSPRGLLTPATAVGEQKTLLGE